MANPVLQMRVPASLLLAPAAQSDDELVHRAQAGDRGAAEALFARHDKPLRRFLSGFVPENEVDDLAQEAHLRALAMLPTFEARSSFSTWLFAIARFAAIDHLRGRARSRIDDSAHSVERATAPMDRLPAQHAGVDRLAAEGEVRDRVLAEVAQLPEPLRRVFLLRTVDGLRFREIADALGEHVPTVKSRMRYAVERLSARLDDLQSWLTGPRRALPAS